MQKRSKIFFIFFTCISSAAVFLVYSKNQLFWHQLFLLKQYPGKIHSKLIDESLIAPNIKCTITNNAVSIVELKKDGRPNALKFSSSTSTWIPVTSLELSLGNYYSNIHAAYRLRCNIRDSVNDFYSTPEAIFAIEESITGIAILKVLAGIVNVDMRAGDKIMLSAPSGVLSIFASQGGAIKFNYNKPTSTLIVSADSGEFSFSINFSYDTATTHKISILNMRRGFFHLEAQNAETMQRYDFDSNGKAL